MKIAEQTQNKRGGAVVSRERTQSAAASFKEAYAACRAQSTEGCTDTLQSYIYIRKCNFSNLLHSVHIHLYIHFVNLLGKKVNEIDSSQR